MACSLLTLAGPQNKDFGPGLQTKLTGGLVLFVVQAGSPQAFLLGKSHFDNKHSISWMIPQN